MTSDKFCLKWNDFATNVAATLKEAREDKEFFDVTLACEENLVEAHRLVISASSPFFRNILKQHSHQHPLIYLKGVKYSDLLAVLNFMYVGEVNVEQQDLTNFLSLAEELKVKGLTQGKDDQLSSPPKSLHNSSFQNLQTKKSTKQNIVSQSLKKFSSENQQLGVKREPGLHGRPNVQQTNFTPSDSNIVAVSDNLNSDLAAYDGYEDDAAIAYDQASMEQGSTMSHDDVINSLMVVLASSEYQCSVCGHSSRNKSNLQKHIDAKHITQDPIFCQFCQKQYPSKNALQSHISRYHNSNRF